MAFVATLVVGVISSFKFLHLDPLESFAKNGTSFESLNMYCFSFFGINGFVMFIAICSAVSRNRSKSFFYSRSVQCF